MTDYIDREALKEYLYGGKFQEGCAGCDEPGEGCIECIVDEIEIFSAADVAPVRHGRWVGDSFCKWQCNKCHAPAPKYGYPVSEFIRSNYCPNCGAKLDLEESNG